MPLLGRERTLFRLFGLPIKADLSWLFLVGLVIVTNAEGLFPHPRWLGPGQPPYVYWVLAVVGAAGLFASLIIHELCHSLVARKTGMPVAGITLFIFGGVSQLQDEPPTAAAEFFMAIVGPLSSVVLGVVFAVAYLFGRFGLGWPAPAVVLLGYLSFINFLLAAFNMLPAFPLDGGRVLRSVLWGITANLRTATKVAVQIGSIFGFLLIISGVFSLFRGQVIGGVWLMVIGFFLRQAAMGSLQMVVMRQQLQGDKVRRFMTTDVVTVPRDMTVQNFVDNYVFHHRFSYYPVVGANGAFVGLLSARAPRSVAPDQWPATPVESVMAPAEPGMALDPETDAVDALSILRLREEHRAVVLQDGRPIGIVSLRDLLGFLALKIDLEPRRRP
jgi:Zn-dependent protease/CBS domain-containing protein